jgi:hypothetical protein
MALLRNFRPRVEGADEVDRAIDREPVNCTSYLGIRQCALTSPGRLLRGRDAGAIERGTGNHVILQDSTMRGVAARVIRPPIRSGDAPE